MWLDGVIQPIYLTAIQVAKREDCESKGHAALRRDWAARASASSSAISSLPST